jgi:cytochrome b6-f complex iron-sulfur subunit
MKGDENKTETRRGFLGKASFLTVVGAFLAQSFSYVRALVPNLLYERPQRAKIGAPDAFADGTTYLEEQNLFIVKEGSSFYAMSATCTHLGCTVKPVRLNEPKVIEEDGKRVTIRQEFHCPCHGSRFYGDGRNYAGPAPRPLDRYKLTRAPEDGRLVVDLGARVDQEYRLTV